MRQPSLLFAHQLISVLMMLMLLLLLLLLQ
jgi:hypothetical protein